MLRWLFPRRPAAAGDVPLSLVLFSRPGCQLCDEMKAEIARARTPIPFVLSEIDIETDADLLECYGRSIPVLRIAGRAAFKGRLTAADFERKLARIARETRTAAVARTGADETI